MQFHLDEISLTVAKGAHAVLLLDRAGWHTTGNLVVPRNMTRVFLPGAEPGRERLAVLAPQLALKPRLDTYEAIVDAACEAWRKLLAQPDTITSIGLRDWARVDQR